MALDAAIDAEAVAQALCMHTGDFERAYRAFAAREKPCSREIDAMPPLKLELPKGRERALPHSSPLSSR